MSAVKKTDVTVQKPKFDQSIDIKRNALFESMNRIIKKAENPNTKRAYKADIKKYDEFCKSYGIDFISGGLTIAIPSTAETMIMFITEQVQQSKKHSTIARAIFAVSKLHKLQDFPSPYTEQVKDFLKAAKKDINKTPKQATAARYVDVEKAVQEIDISTTKGLRDKAVLLLCFAGCLRRSEVAELHITDNQDAKGFIQDHANGLEIVLKDFKHANGEQITKSIPYAANPLLCPVRAVKAWIEVLAKDNPEQTLLFVSVHRSGSILNKPINGQTVYNIIKKHLGDGFSGHSLRVGFAVSANESGAELDTIKKHGGWKTDAMPSHYVKQSDRWENNAASQIFKKA